MKRAFDILFSLVVLIIFFPFGLLISIAILLSSRGGVFYRQERIGKRGKPFMLFKFRSMKLNADKKGKLTVGMTDSRITKIGVFIRKYKLDEFPQFINVLIGDMSVVGPRPHLPSLSSEYQKDVDDYLKRHAVKPGITGLAQVSGYRGEIKKKSDIKNRVRLDIFYIENWSFLLDVKIILMTVFNVFKGEENAY